MPVHPTLAALLAEWKLGGWAAMMGRPPTADDLVVPLPPQSEGRGRPNPRAGGMRTKSDSFKRFATDLRALGLRHRRGHDLRRTMISLARMDGARADLLQVCTHNPRSGQGTIDLYTSYDWAALCGEVAKLRNRARRARRGHPAARGRWGRRRARRRRRNPPPCYSACYSRWKGGEGLEKKGGGAGSRILSPACSNSRRRATLQR